MTRADLLERLRELRPWLESRGVSELRLFGSFARDEAGPESDVDLLVEVTRPMGFEFYGIQDDISERLGRPVDLCTERDLNRYVLRRALREAVNV